MNVRARWCKVEYGNRTITVFFPKDVPSDAKFLSIVKSWPSPLTEGLELALYSTQEPDDLVVTRRTDEEA